MIFSIDHRHVSVVTDEPTAAYDGVVSTHETVVVQSAGTLLKGVRATVEILREGGGLMPRALIGGSFTPNNGLNLVVEVANSGTIAVESHMCASQLGGPLAAGLPDEFIPAVVEGINTCMPFGGRVIIDRAGFDAVESASGVFRVAAELLAIVLRERAMGLDESGAVRDAITAWA